MTGGKDNRTAEFDDIEQRIKESLNYTREEGTALGGLGIAKWTRLIKKELTTFGHERGFGVIASGCDYADAGEWLLEMVWVTGNNDMLEEMPLSMECEWNLDEHEIVWNFEKLLVVRSKYRLFIFNQKTSAEVDRTLEFLRAKIKGFRGSQVGDRYLFAGYSWDEEKFRYALEVVAL